MDLIYPSVWRRVAGERGGDWSRAGLGLPAQPIGSERLLCARCFPGTGCVLTSRVPAPRRKWHQMPWEGGRSQLATHGVSQTSQTSSGEVVTLKAGTNSSPDEPICPGGAAQPPGPSQKSLSGPRPHQGHPGRHGL